MIENIAEAKIDPAKLFAGEGVDQLLATVTKELKQTTFDISTKEGRDQCASVAYKVAKTKTYIDEMGKKYVADKKAEIAKVDATRRVIWDGLETIQKDVRKPLTDFETSETARVTDHETRIAAIGLLATFVDLQPSAKEIQQRLDALPAQMQRDWQEFGKRATEVADSIRDALQAKLTERRKLDADQAELEQLRLQNAAREQKEREQRLKDEAAAKATREAQDAIAAESARAEAAIKAANAAAQKATQDAEAAKALAVKQTKDAAAKAERDKQAAVEAERARAAKAKADEDAAAAKRESNKRHCAKINNEALDGLKKATGLDDDICKTVIQALAKGNVPHIAIAY